MNDFTRLLADLHGLPNTPGLLRGRDLPLDSDHLDTQEGRHLYRAVAALRGQNSDPLDTQEGRQPYQGAVPSLRGQGLDTQKGRQLYQAAVASLSGQGCEAREGGGGGECWRVAGSRPQAEADERRACRCFEDAPEGGGGGGCWRVAGFRPQADERRVCRCFEDAGHRLDSGFDECDVSFVGPDAQCDVSFVGPDDLSVSCADTEAESLGERFRAINARYERELGLELEDSASLSISHCYSLGGRFV